MRGKLCHCEKKEVEITASRIEVVMRKINNEKDGGWQFKYLFFIGTDRAVVGFWKWKELDPAKRNRTGVLV